MMIKVFFLVLFRKIDRWTNGCTYLVDVEALNEGAQLRKTLAPTPTNTHQEDITLRLLNDSTNAGDVLDGKLEEHQIHWVVRHLIVILQIRLHHSE